MLRSAELRIEDSNGPDVRVRCEVYQSKFESGNMTNAPTLAELTEQLIQFRDDRDWRQFHSLKDLILSLNLEAAELLELSQWKPEADFEEEALTEPMLQRLNEECADVLLYLLLIAERTGIDLQKAAAEKIKANDLKYPVEKSHGKSTKYTQL